MPQLQSTLTKLLNPTKILLGIIIIIGVTACGEGFNACGKVYKTKAEAEQAAKDCKVDNYSKLEQLILQTGDYNFGKEPLAKLSTYLVGGQKSFVSDGYDENVHFVFKNSATDNFKTCDTFDSTYPSYYIEADKKFVVTLRQRTFTESAHNPALTNNTANAVYDLLAYALGKKSKQVDGKEVYKHYNIADGSAGGVASNAYFNLTYGINEKGAFDVECKVISLNKYQCAGITDFANHALFVAPAGPISLFAKAPSVEYKGLKYPKGIVTVKAAYQLVYDEFKKDKNITVGTGKWSYKGKEVPVHKIFDLAYKIYGTNPLFCLAPNRAQHVFFTDSKPFPAHY